MKITIDCRELQYNKGGISRSIASTIKLLKNKHEFHVLLNNPDFRLDDTLIDSNVKVHYAGPRWHILNFLWENTTLVKLLRKIKPDIHHAPCNFGIPYFKPGAIKYVVTLHDTIPLHFPDAYAKHTVLRWHVSVRLSLQKADAIVTDSHYSKNEISAYFKVPLGKIHVVPLYVEDTFNKEDNPLNILKIKDKYKINGDYIIYYGGFLAYKNVKKIIQVFDHYKKTVKDKLKLCVVGKKDRRFFGNVFPYINTCHSKHDIITTDYVCDKELSLLLNGAKALVYLSKIEGFGYAPLEAMACGTPVLCSRNSSLPEMLGDSVMWVNDNQSAEAIANTLRQFLQNKDQTDRFVREGLNRISFFRKSAFKERMSNVYQTISGQSLK